MSYVLFFHDSQLDVVVLLLLLMSLLLSLAVDTAAVGVARLRTSHMYTAHHLEPLLGAIHPPSSSSTPMPYPASQQRRHFPGRRQQHCKHTSPCNNKNRNIIFSAYPLPAVWCAAPDSAGGVRGRTGGRGGGVPARERGNACHQQGTVNTSHFIRSISPQPFFSIHVSSAILCDPYLLSQTCIIWAPAV